jgi:histone H2B
MPKTKRKTRSYAPYLYRTLKSIHPDTGISKKGMEVMVSFCDDMFERIMTEAQRLTDHKHAKTLGIRSLQSAVRIVLPKELAAHSIDAGQKATIKFLETKPAVHVRAATTTPEVDIF